MPRRLLRLRRQEGYWNLATTLSGYQERHRTYSTTFRRTFERSEPSRFATAKYDTAGSKPQHRLLKQKLIQVLSTVVPLDLQKPKTIEQSYDLASDSFDNEHTASHLHNRTLP